MFKKGSKVKNIYTNKRREIVAVDTVTVKQNPFTQVTVYTLDNGIDSRVQMKVTEKELNKHWREVE